MFCDNGKCNEERRQSWWLVGVSMITAAWPQAIAAGECREDKGAFNGRMLDCRQPLRGRSGPTGPQPLANFARKVKRGHKAM